MLGARTPVFEPRIWDRPAVKPARVAHPHNLGYSTSFSIPFENSDILTYRDIS